MLVALYTLVSTLFILGAFASFAILKITNAFTLSQNRSHTAELVGMALIWPALVIWAIVAIIHDLIKYR